MVNWKAIAVAATSLLAGLADAAPTTRREVNIRSTTVVKDGYIIKLKPGVADDLEAHTLWVSNIHKRNLAKRGLDEHTYRGIERMFTGKNHFNGYAGEFDELTIEEIRNSPEVEYVEKDRAWVIDYIEGDILETRDVVTQEDAPWGLGAISHRVPGSDEYIYDEAAGEATFAYVVDSGIRETHEQFEGRATAAWTAFDGDHEDTNGHGTHVAGTIAGRDYGVAKKAHVLAAKVSQGADSSTSIIVDGISWAIDDIIARNRTGKAVVNLSLGGGRSLVLDDLINDGVARGVVIVAAAGNENQPVSNVSPAAAESAITVGAVNSDFEIWVDHKKQGSNFGPEIDIFAPGVNVVSAGIASDKAKVALTGTSMASPHVAGLVLYAMSVDGICGVEAITERLLENGTPGVIRGDLRGSVNLIANNGNSEQ